MGVVQRSSCAALLILLHAYVSAGDAASVSAVQKVIQLLTDMAGQAKKMKSDEEVAYSKFAQYCSNEQGSKTKGIRKASALMERLFSDIQQHESDVTQLGAQLAELSSGIEQANAGLRSSAAQVEKDKTSFAEQIQDYGESVDSLTRAIDVLKKQSVDKEQGSEALIQLASSPAMPAAVRRTLTAFLEMKTGGDYLTREGPQAKAYVFQSGGVVETLEKLRDDFAAKKGQTEKENINARHASGMLSQDLTDSVEQMTAHTDAKTATKAEKTAAIAKARKQLISVTRDHDSDTATLAALKTECEEKSRSFEEKQKLRADEILAIEKATEILSSPDVLDAAQVHLPSLAQRGTSLAQFPNLRAGGAAGGGRAALLRFLVGEGRRLRSDHLGLLADKVSSTGPLDKVKKLIMDLIHQLLAEHLKESDQKGFCDKEVRTNAMTRTKLQQAVDSLTAEIDEGMAFNIEAGQRLATLQKDTAELHAALEEATSMRTAEKAKNAETVTDAQKAQTAIREASAILKDFYSKAFSATALVQADSQAEPVKMHSDVVKINSEEWNALAKPDAAEVDRGHKDGMQTFGDTYKGQTSEVGGVLAVLEVVMSDFSQLEAETSASENEATTLHDDFVRESGKAIAVKTKETEMLTVDRASSEAELVRLKQDLADHQDQLLAAERYHDSLKLTCVDTGISYNDRATARDDEINSLTEALTMLKSTDFDA